MGITLICRVDLPAATVRQGLHPAFVAARPEGFIHVLRAALTENHVHAHVLRTLQAAMEGVSNIPGEVHKGDVDRTLRELDNAIKDIEEALKQVCF
jgi:hypothetical protein